MAIDVIMPQMGESIAEGTVIRWMKKVGDAVERDEPLFEISTDKVDAEIPSPAAGTLSEVLVAEGETVPVNAVVARLAGAGEEAADPPASQEAMPAADPNAAEQSAANVSTRNEVAQEATGVESDEHAVAEPPQQNDAAPEEESSDDANKVESLEERRRTRSSPLVRKIAKENDVDISKIEGSGVSGRVTKKDILQFIESPTADKKPAAAASAAPAPRSAPGQTVSFKPGENVHIEPMSMMRKKIADHMIVSRRTSAHVSTVFEVDFTSVGNLRKKHKQTYEERGAKLTYLPFIVQAVVTALREFPVINASIDGDSVVYKKDINVGIAVALDWGLIVPVLKKADEKNILGLTKAISDIGERARTKKLSPDEVQGGTFTITNPGIYGGLFGLPIINQPQVAILGVGGVKKKPVVIETAEGDAIVIRSMSYLSLTFDHRLIDGAVADQFMARIKGIIEGGQYAL